MRRYAAVTDATLRLAAEAVSGNETWQSSSKRELASALSRQGTSAIIRRGEPVAPWILSGVRMSAKR